MSHLMNVIDYSKAKKNLGWEPKTKFVDLVKIMVDADVQKVADKLAGRVKVMEQQ
jgi:GDPmannose 4,6-dehydratase